MKTLVLIDIQNDFMPGGALAVEKGNEIVPLVNELQKKFDLVIATQDWHANGHSSFASAHRDAKVFDLIKLNGLDQVLWPDHCVQNTPGAEFHPELDTNRIETIFRKGTDLSIDSYSGFYDNAHLKSTGLSGYLKEKGVQNVYFAGLAGDYCVAYSVLDSIAEGFNTTLIEDATRAIDKEGFDQMKLEILRKGGTILNSAELEF
ncbi:bifunctional nicotinamidase/pyrazinamidase [uncultured Christiangramia sp.]|uniref:bifunctional nicotinamidase/pyrazinamidase n=1 Tax=Christiangramia sp. 3-2217-3z TaxID=3417564 RepID=UPI00262C1297|nr:bifunctional nicotinamidase/pyrazinamidase [uncultured Christiangramia sp.]|tara:strand:+ start:4879 stop:5490 length:612 start_codon:yes stop_codon:yes gene_type:complete